MRRVQALSPAEENETISMNHIYKLHVYELQLLFLVLQPTFILCIQKITGLPVDECQFQNYSVSCL